MNTCYTSSWECLSSSNFFFFFFAILLAKTKSWWRKVWWHSCQWGCGRWAYPQPWEQNQDSLPGGHADSIKFKKGLTFGLSISTFCFLIVIIFNCKIHTTCNSPSLLLFSVKTHSHYCATISRTFLPCKTETVPIAQLPISPPPSPWNPPFHSASLILTTLGTSIKWTPAAFFLLRLAYFTQHKVLKVHPCSILQNFVPF